MGASDLIWGGFTVCEGSRWDFARIWGGVWEALGRFLGGLGEDFEKNLGRFWEDIFVSETPALPRQLAWRQQYAKVPHPRRVLDHGY